MWYQSLRVDTSHSERKPFVEGGDLLREEVFHWERGPFIKVGKRPFVKEGTLYLTHGRIPFIKRGGHLLREGGGHSLQEGEGHVLRYELDLAWVWWEERTWEEVTRMRNFCAQHDHLMLEFQWTSTNCNLFTCLLTSRMCGKEDEGDTDGDSDDEE